jgi:phosphoglycerate dehydrogenase-like enzyme
LTDVTLLSLLPLSDAQLRHLQHVSDRLQVHHLAKSDQDQPPTSLLEQVDIILGGGKFLTQELRAPQLRWVQVTSAGVDWLFDTPLWRSNIVITNASGIHLTPIAERTLAMMLAFRAGLPTLWRYQARREWPVDRWEQFANPNLRGSTLGIVGYGAIGSELARQADALGMRVLAVNRTGQRRPIEGYFMAGTGDPEMRIPEQVYRPDELLSMLPQCDHVVVLAPLTASTRHLIDARAFASMKPSAYFYNYGRGGLVDEAALTAALQAGQIAGAGLDVFEEEPLPATSPLWDLPNVIISPHVGGMQADYDDRALELFTENLRRYLNDEPLFNVVNRDLGY